MERRHANKILTANDKLGTALSTFEMYAQHDSGSDQRRQQWRWEGVIAERLHLYSCWMTYYPDCQLRQRKPLYIIDLVGSATEKLLAP